VRGSGASGFIHYQRRSSEQEMIPGIQFLTSQTAPSFENLERSLRFLVSTHSDLRIFFSDFQADDLRYGTTEALLDSLEEVSRLLNAYSKAILASSSDS
jgi:hypothetical protein